MGSRRYPWGRNRGYSNANANPDAYSDADTYLNPKSASHAYAVTEAFANAKATSHSSTTSESAALEDPVIARKRCVIGSTYNSTEKSEVNASDSAMRCP